MDLRRRLRSSLRFFAASCACLAASAPARAAAEGPSARSVDTWEAERERWPLYGEPSRGETWLSVGAFVRAPDGGPRDLGVLAVVGAAFDRIAARHAPVVRRGGGGGQDGGAAGGRLDLAALVPDVTALAPLGEPGARSARELLVTREVARRAVSAAWRAAALGADDARIDAMVSRARWSAALPETRLRAMRVFDDGASPDSAGTSSSYGTRGNLWLEARLTWRFDHLLYADDEPAFERVRTDRLEARQRTASRVVALLAQWQRASVDGRAAPLDSPEALDAALRASEAEAGLDALTGGWFGAWAEGARREARAPPSAARP